MIKLSIPEVKVLNSLNNNNEEDVRELLFNLCGMLTEEEVIEAAESLEAKELVHISSYYEDTIEEEIMLTSQGRLLFLYEDNLADTNVLMENLVGYIDDPLPARFRY